MVAGAVPAVRTGDGAGSSPVAGREMGFAAGDEDRPEQARRDDGFVYANLTAQTGQEMTMEAKMPEKWEHDGAWFSMHDGRRYYAGGQADAKVFVEAANGAIDQAYAAGLEAGKAQVATKPAEPAPMVLTDVEKVVWGQVYAAALSVYESKELDNSHVLAMEAADAAIAALRVRSAPGQEPGEVVELNARIAELETQLAAARQGAEINRAEGAKAERERCAGIVRTRLAISGNKFAQDASRSILEAILSPTT